ncbi:DUF2818 family protein [Sulfuriflexus mobilis]|uniref:DUF2818 family protein n=1 Tax=Sulfuriflexus mobilis TaxID=1811807 RepID=UPI000F8226FB|nr:DUF2818 family protein [Sulfuriflexus mobilis]
MWIIILIVMAILAANLPWLSERLFLVRDPGEEGKRPWMRFLEWFILYLIMGGIAIALEIRATGGTHAQDWEFYAVTICLFLIFALPGFIYRHDLKHLLDRARR